MSKMRWNKSAAVKRTKQAWLLVVHFAWMAIFVLGTHKMDNRLYDIYHIRLVDGYNLRYTKEGLCMAIQKTIFRNKKDLFLSRLRTQFQSITKDLHRYLVHVIKIKKPCRKVSPAGLNKIDFYTDFMPCRGVK